MMTYEELKSRTAWTLEQKIDHAAGAISGFMERMNGNIYIAYSGGKDSFFFVCAGYCPPFRQ
jgi:tRNA(Ile)-lysidine synthase TilS/MesJ